MDGPAGIGPEGIGPEGGGPKGVSPAGGGYPARVPVRKMPWRGMNLGATPRPRKPSPIRMPHTPSMPETDRPNTIYAMVATSGVVSPHVRQQRKSRDRRDQKMTATAIRPINP